jgi:hypothetical protein
MSLRLEDHVLSGLENQKKLLEFLGEYSWGVDLDQGVLTFTRPPKQGLATMFGAGQPELIARCPIQVLGTRSESSQTWLWAWANVQSQIPAQLLRGVEQIKAEGERQNLSQFSEASFPMPEDTPAYALSIICTRHLNLFCPFVCPYQGGAMFTAIESCPEAQNRPRNGLLVMSTLQLGITTFSFSHRPAVLAYLGAPSSTQGDELTWDLDGEPIKIRFDASDRIIDMQSTLRKAS